MEPIENESELSQPDQVDETTIPVELLEEPELEDDGVTSHTTESP